MLQNKVILITGGTGSFGHHFVDYALKNYKPKKIIIYSRDEYKQFLMEKKYSNRHDDILRFFIGDVRDEARLRRAMRGVDYVIHAAALKQVPACEYNPNEAIKTNVNGAMNVINASLDMGVKKVVALSTDKAVNPINLYGGTKLVSDKLFTAAKSYSGLDGTVFSVVRYGNVAGSRGSVFPFFKMGDLEEGVKLVILALKEAHGGETFISKIPSFKVMDLAEAMLAGCDKPEVGIREGEKLHEIMITREDSLRTYEYEKYFVIYPQYNWWNNDMLIPGGKLVRPEFEYSSGTNAEWLGVKELKEKLRTDLDIY